MKKFAIVAALFVATFSFTGSASAAPKELTLIITVSYDQVYTASVQVLNGLEFDVTNSDKEGGVISAEHKNRIGAPNQFLTLTFTKAGVSQTEVTVSIRKQMVIGGNAEKTLMAFQNALSKRLGKNVSITVKDSEN